MTRRLVAHRRAVVLVWILLAAGLLATSRAVGAKTSNDVTLPNTDSQRAFDMLHSRFPAESGDRDAIVFSSRRGKLTDRSVRIAISDALDQVSRLPHVATVVGPYRAGAHALSQNRRIGFASVEFDRRAKELPTSAVARVVETAETARSPQLQVELGGAAIEKLERPSLSFATIVGIAAAVIVLLASFGSLAAMSLPIVTALLGLATGLGIIGIGSHVVGMVDFSSDIALMIGLGVGVDYALFIVTRYRAAYRDNGGKIEDAVETAMGTAGRAVLFAGTTVVIALLGMFALGIRFLYGLAIAAALGVLLVLAASLTLLPAMLTFAGHRVGRSRRAADGRVGANDLWLRWTAFVQRRALVATAATTVLLLALASPALGLRLGASDSGNDPPTHTTRRAYDLLAEGFGPGFSGPLLLAVRLPDWSARSGLPRLMHTLRETEGIASVAAPQLNAAGTVAAIPVYPTSSPQSAQTTQLVKRLREHVLPPLTTISGATVYIGGQTALEVDFARLLARELPLFIGIVVALSAIVLLVVFRSFVIPLQAAVMNLLSIAASLGIVQAIFERGWLSGLLGIQRGPIDAFIPVLMFAVVFGLSMDYEVFLVSRIYEEWQASRNAAKALREGVARTGRVVTAAAAIMIVVFASFAAGDNRVLELFGFALAIAVFLDAIVIRCVLLPAVLELLGARTWGIPRWLDRRLPRVAIEAEPAIEPAPAFEDAA